MLCVCVSRPVRSEPTKFAASSCQSFAAAKKRTYIKCTTKRRINTHTSVTDFHADGVHTWRERPERLQFGVLFC